MINDNIYFPKPIHTFIFNWWKFDSFLKISNNLHYNSNVAIYLLSATPFYTESVSSKFIKGKVHLNSLYLYFLYVFKTTFGDGFVYLRGLFVILFIDALIADDEPIWDPVEWSLLQS